MTPLLLLSCLIGLVTIQSVASQSASSDPVSIILLIRYGIDQLPYLLGSIDRLTYPKDKINLWIRVSHNNSETKEMVEEWAGSVSDFYNSIDFEVNAYKEGQSKANLTEEKLYKIHQIAVTQEGINEAKLARSKFALVIEDGLFLSYDSLLEHLISKFSENRAIIIAPMIEVPGRFYSNFWTEIAPNGDYEHSSDYDEINDHKKTGVFPVKVVHTVWMLDLRGIGALLEFTKPIPEGVYTEATPGNGPVQMNYWSEQRGGKIMISNMEHFGYMTLPRGWYNDNKELRDAIQGILTDLTFEKGYMVSEFIQPKQSKLSAFFDKVYVINLKRRPFKRASAVNTLFELGFTNAVIFEAIDGKQIKDGQLRRDGIKVLPEYEDPYRGGSMKTGEIACLLSHYYIWKEALEARLDRVLILEDDFSPVRGLWHVNRTWEKVEPEINSLNSNWDLLYLGRRIMGNSTKDKPIPDLSNLVYAGYSHWAVAYGLTARGLRKLVASEPLGKMVSTDDLIAILSGAHKREDWSAAYPTRDMVTLSVRPTIIEPRHFPDDKQFYSSDTEDYGLGYSRHDEL